MITSKYISAIVAVFVGLALVGSLAMAALGGSSAARTTEYEKRLFNGETVNIEIEVDADDWQSLLDNAQAKEYISANLTINGQLFSTVGIRTKGNSSLASGGERYSLQLNPDKYVKGQSFYGLDTMCLNNLMGDATYMKDTISYDIMEYLGVAAPLRNYAYVTVNGEDYGLFLLLERYDDSFLDRNYGSSTGELYNVKMQMGERSNFEAGEFEPTRPEGGESGEEGGFPGGGDFTPPEGFTPPGGEEGGMPFNPGDFEGMEPGQMPDFGGQMPDGDGTQTMPGMGGFGMGMFSSGGGSLVYTDDDPASYGSIFNNAVSSKVSDKDQQQVITAIQKLNEGADLEEYWDVDEILRYLAAHTFVVNLDSYVSSMQQNYYLLERNGVLSVLPWDYNLAFGGFNSGDASSVVNFPIDTPVSGVAMEDRPLVSQLLAVEEYAERYHEYLNEIVEGYVQSGRFEETVARLDAQISDDVERDPTAYYTHEEYEAALEVFKQLVALRAESVAGQLAGSIPATAEGQSENPESLIDPGGLDLSALGSMGGGMGGPGEGGGRQWPGSTAAEGDEADDTTQQDAAGQDDSAMPGNPPADGGTLPGQDGTGQPPAGAGEEIGGPPGEPPEEAGAG